MKGGVEVGVGKDFAEGWGGLGQETRVGLGAEPGRYCLFEEQSMSVHVLFCCVGDETTDKGGKNVVPCYFLFTHGCDQPLDYLFVRFER